MMFSAFSIMLLIPAAALIITIAKGKKILPQSCRRAVACFGRYAKTLPARLKYSFAIISAAEIAFCSAAIANKYQDANLNKIEKLYETGDTGKIAELVSGFGGDCRVADIKGRQFVNPKTGNLQTASINLSIMLAPVKFWANMDFNLKQDVNAATVPQNYVVLGVIYGDPASYVYYFPTKFETTQKGWKLELSNMKVANRFGVLYGDEDSQDYNTLEVEGGQYYGQPVNFLFQDSDTGAWHRYSNCQRVDPALAFKLATGIKMLYGQSADGK